MTPKNLSIPNSVLCVAAVKYATLEEILPLIKEGFTTLGWSTVQQFRKLSKILPHNCRHHFIGYLQKNKVNQLVLSDIDLIHSVDRMDLIETLAGAAQSKSKIQYILLQVKTDVTKEHGFTYEEIDAIFPSLLARQSLSVKGLMTIPPLVDNPEENRAIYKRMREFRDYLEQKYHISLPYLSMGMSNDYKIAIEEGATMIRLGRILLGKEV